VKVQTRGGGHVASATKQKRRNAPVLGQSTIRRRIVLSDDARYLTVGQTCEHLGFSDMWIVRRTADANFPKPVLLDGARVRRWRLADLEAWERTCINEGVS
jgi:predicted DNA-binding transcriptional regulator AlpA